MAKREVFRHREFLMLVGFLLLSLSLLSGCAFDAQTLILSNPQVQDFLDKYPNADVSIIHFSVEEAAQEADNFADVCGKSLTTPKELYKAEIIDAASGLRVIAYLDAANGKAECVKKFGNEGEVLDSPGGSSEPTLPEPAVPEATTGQQPSTLPADTSAASLSRCGNSVIEGAEECDDGNSDSTDGCAACQFVCVDSDGGDSLYKKGTVKGAFSGQKEVRQYLDQCDSSIRNRLTEYACGDFEATGKRIASGNRDCPYGCSDGACVSPVGVAICGNGVLDSGEECDDGNEKFKDGCTTACKLKCWDTDSGDDKDTTGEVRIIYQGQSKVFADRCDTSTPNRVQEYACRDTDQTNYASYNRDCPNGCSDGRCLQAGEASLCGNSIIDSGEVCDDGNSNNGDGCSSACGWECTDSDGGGSEDEFVRGTTRGGDSSTRQITSKTDTCRDTQVLIENWCNSLTGYIQTGGETCAYGCSDGACRREAEQTTQQPVATDTSTGCTETDDRNDPYKKSTTKGKDIYNQDKESTDTCVNSQKLKEYYCAAGSTDGRFLEVETSCQYGCSNGVCIKNAGDIVNANGVVICSDSDGGGSNGQFVKGTTNGIDGFAGGRKTETDYCHENGWLVESWCNTVNGNVQTGAITCSYGCSEGACRREAGETEQATEQPAAPPAEETAPTYTIDNPQSCTDSDGGSNGLVKGTTKIFYTGGSTTYMDSCAGQSVTEHLCNGNKHTTGTVYCANLCVDGACIICGNGKVEGTCSVSGYIDRSSCMVSGKGTWDGEQCDDGNTQSGDGCSSSCTIERRLVY